MRTRSQLSGLLSLTLGVVALATVDGCNAISGVDDFDFQDQPADASIEGSAGAGGSSGSGGSAGKDAAADSDAQETATADANDALPPEDAPDGSEAEAALDAPEDTTGDESDAAIEASDTDAADAGDAPDSAEADAPTIDAPAEAADAPFDAAEAGCSSNTDCASQSATPYCDKPSGECVECLAVPDTCPKGKYCVASTLACETGCKNDSDCTGGATCNLASHQCAVAGNELCAGGADEDNDGRIDCFDPDCVANAACDGFCTEAETLVCGQVVTGKNTGAAGSTQRLAPPPYSCTAGEYPGPERTFKVAAAAGQNVFAEVYGVGADLAVFAVNPASGAQCNATTSCAAFGDLLTTPNAEALGFTAEAGKDYYVVVDGAAAADFSLSVQCAPSTGCFPARAIQSGQTITTSNASGQVNVTTNINHHAQFATSGWLAPEAAFIFTPTVTGSYTIKISGLKGGGQFACDLDLFLKASTACADDCLAVGATTGEKPESITFDATANTSYFIVVDGYATGGVPCISDFTLAITGP